MGDGLAESDANPAPTWCEHGGVRLADRYPLLHQPDRWEWAQITMRFSSQIPDDDLVVSTHVVAFVDDEVLLCQDAASGVWFLPGGTREPCESVEASLERELMEEAGARLLGRFQRLGAHVGISEADMPYRPHLPHPRQAWLWGWADAEIVGPPTAPAEGEAISAVRHFSVSEAVHRASNSARWVGELIVLAAERRGIGYREPD